MIEFYKFQLLTVKYLQWCILGDFSGGVKHLMNHINHFLELFTDEKNIELTFFSITMLGLDK